MVKPLTFRVDVERAAAGDFLAALDRIDGIIDYGVVKEPKLNGAHKPPAKKFDEKAEDFIGQLLMKAPTPTKVLREHFADVGRRPGSTSSALNLMKTDDLIKKQDDGKTWMLTKKGRDRYRVKK